MISADLIPEALHRLEYQIGLKKDRLTKNMARQWDLQQEEIRFRQELQVLEMDKWRLLSGRNI